MAEIEKVARALIESAEEFAPITVHAKGIGTFPSIKRPRVIWVGVAGQLDELRKLQKTLDHKLAEVGFPKEKRAFKGHLTLGRVKNRIDPKRLLSVIQEFSGFESDPFVVDKVVVFKSELKPTGADYSKLAEISLMAS
jgi:2'-5' RNA ligase